MNLRDYIEKEAAKHGVSLAAFRSKLAFDANMPAGSLEQYAYKGKKPGAAAAVKLYKATNKEVTLNDLLLEDHE